MNLLKYRYSLSRLVMLHNFVCFDSGNWKACMFVGDRIGYLVASYDLI